MNPAEEESGVPPLLPNEAYDTAMPLAEREAKWGFTLDELRAGTKVVRTLFSNPALFVGDPYLSDSRLYTMITRDRQKKREHRETYKIIMNEEKSRRQKYLREQNLKALDLTIMKREREAALSALCLQIEGPPDAPLLLQDRQDGDQAQVSASDAPAPSHAPTVAEKAQLRLMGAFENVLRLEQCLTRQADFTSTAATSTANADGTVGSPTDPPLTAREAARLAQTVDWAAASQLTAQVYRYVPHLYGSQMPPPLFPGPIPSHTADRERLNYIRGIKVHLARQAVEQVAPSPVAEPLETAEEGGEQPAKRFRTEAATETADTLKTFASLAEALTQLAALNSRGEGHEVVVLHLADEAGTTPTSTTMRAFGRVSALREYFAAPTLTAAETVLFPPQDEGSGKTTTHFRLARTADVLDALDAVLVQGYGVDDSFWRGSQGHPSAMSEMSRVASAEMTLHLLLARRLYGNPRLRSFGPSPLVIERAPPASESEEPEEWSAFDDLPLYATEHYDGEKLNLTNWIACHTCKVRFNRLHPYYYSMCHLCGEFNYNKRLLTRDLRGKVVLLTGCRIKIGFAMALSLLRCGATVLGTTRFAHEAVARFQQEVDYDVWKDRLHLYSLDLRDLWIVTQFCGFVRQRFPKLFAIINNAAQTIARTPQYTEHLRHIEIHPSAALRDAIQRDASANEWNQFFLRHTSVTVGEALSIEHAPAAQPFLPIEHDSHTSGDATRPGPSAAVEELQEEEEEGKEDKAGKLRALTTTTTTTTTGYDTSNASEKPSGIIDHVPSAASTALVFDRYDTQAEESDHRQTNSWVMKLAEVQGGEAAEVMAINALAPFIMNGKLKPCLTNREGDATPNESRFIINVSAMEGQFYRFKQTTHPHTNMAKAALNMMTRTSAADYAEDGIYMNSVDTGWITDESPKLKKERRAEQYLMCPLDEVDAAARCLDLIYTDSTIHGCFYKDFKFIPW